MNKQWPEELRSKDSEEVRSMIICVRPENFQHNQNQIKAVLGQWNIDHSNEVLKKLLQPRGKVTCAVNASSLLARDDKFSGNFVDRLNGIQLSGFGVRHGILVRSLMAPFISIGPMVTTRCHFVAHFEPPNHHWSNF